MTETSKSVLRKTAKIIPEISGGQNAKTLLFSRALGGVPGGIRTHDLPLRRRTLYPTELRKHIGAKMLRQLRRDGWRAQSTLFDYSVDRAV